MNILIITSSSRKNGNTNKILQLFQDEIEILSKARNISLNIEWIYLAERNIMICKGCRICFDRGEEKCPLKDEVLAIMDKMLAADVIIAASPVYMDDVNAIMKNFIDRLSFISHRPSLAGKLVYTICTVGGKFVSHTLRTMNAAFLVWGAYVLGSSGFPMGERMSLEETERRFRLQLQRVAKKVLNSYEKKKNLYPSFLSLITFYIQKKAWMVAGKGSIDYEFWHKSGYFEKGAIYYYKVKTGLLKRMIVKLIGWIAYKIILG